MRLKFYTIKFFKSERQVGAVQIIIFLLAIFTAVEWLINNKSEYEPYTIILASIGGILDIVKRIVREPILPRVTFEETTFKSSHSSSFFIGATITNLNDALKIAKKEEKGLFIVIYDNKHPTKSKLNHSLGYFSEYELTKRLINEHFVQAIIDSEEAEVQKYIPENYHMEKCLLVTLNRNGEIMRQEEVYGNPDVGLRRVREDVEKLK